MCPTGANSFDPYETLGVDGDADAESIKRAYRERSKSAHPDTDGGSRAAWDKLTKAYALLTDDKRRHHFDRTGDTGDDAYQQGDTISEALGLLDSTVMKLINEAISRAEDVTKIDFMFRIRSTLEAVIPAQLNEIAEAEKTLQQLGLMRERLTYKGKGANVFERIIQGRERLCGIFITNSNRNIDVHERALEILVDYDYRWDQGSADEQALRRQMQMVANVRSRDGYLDGNPAAL